MDDTTKIGTFVVIGVLVLALLYLVSRPAAKSTATTTNTKPASNVWDALASLGGSAVEAYSYA